MAKVNKGSGCFFVLQMLRNTPACWGAQWEVPGPKSLLGRQDGGCSIYLLVKTSDICFSRTSLSLLESWKCKLSIVNVLLSHTRTRNTISVWMMYEVNGSCTLFVQGLTASCSLSPPFLQSIMDLKLWPSLSAMYFSYAQLLPNRGCRIRHKAAAYDKWYSVCRLCRAGGQTHY